VLHNPLHPYTAGLLASTVHGQDKDRDIDAIPGSPPDMRRLPQGCSFAPRCTRRVAECPVVVPRPGLPVQQRWVACHNPNASQ
jgi:peptide/nickel transport system ATP-binding protein